MRSRRHVLVSAILLAAFAWALRAREAPTPTALLTPERLRRLQRERDRQTERWINFETRVQTVADSPERGFELALYYAVTHDPARGREALAWALAHPCDRRQVALILDWCGDLLSDKDREKLAACPAPDPSSPGADPSPSPPPLELLLSLKPAELEHPDWRVHIAALVSIALDPNSRGAQFLQGWALEQSQTLREGPGVGYEFLWADPYLPGIAYRNAEPWVYSGAGRLFARTSWDPDACWIAISRDQAANVNCPPDWRDRPLRFGSLNLVPITARCIEVPPRPDSETTILWRLRPAQPISFRVSGRPESNTADPAGLFQLPVRSEGKVCVSR